MQTSEISLEAVSSVSQIPAEQWDACANPRAGRIAGNGGAEFGSSQFRPDSRWSLASSYNPFISHAFFAALETSGSACPRTGWGPRHLIARVGDSITGIVPCYLKSHSRGEYVFDRGWADAFERAGGNYYPKLQASV